MPQDPPLHTAEAELVDAHIQTLLALGDTLQVADDDARKVMVRQLTSSAGLALAVLDLLAAVRQQSPEAVHHILRVSSPDYLTHYYADVLHAAKMSWLSVAEFQLRAGISNLLHAVDPGGWTKEWPAAPRRLAARIALPLDQDAEDALIVPLLLSHAMHANGMHHSAEPFDRVYSVAGMRYEFREGQPLVHDGWGDIVHALTAAVGVMATVLGAEGIRRIGHVPYVSSGGDHGLT
jgi:hypothetical protein